MILKMQRVAMVPYEDDSDLRCHRLYTEFIDRDGALITGVVYRGGLVEDGKRVSDNCLYMDLSRVSCLGPVPYPVDTKGLPYCSKSVLDVVNSLVFPVYTGIYILSEWEDVDYPEWIWKLHESHDRMEHLDLYSQAADAVYHDYTALARDYSYLTKEEYKSLVKYALFNAWVQFKGTSFENVAYNYICQEVFNCQKVIDPQEDATLIKFITAFFPEWEQAV